MVKEVARAIAQLIDDGAQQKVHSVEPVARRKFLTIRRRSPYTGEDHNNLSSAGSFFTIHDLSSDRHLCRGLKKHIF
jgi:hypothetical protein